MLDLILGNTSAARALLHVFHYGEIHASAIARDYKIALTPIRYQLERFENAGILVAKQVGRSRLFSFNKKSPWVKSLLEIIELAYESIPLEERQVLFAARRRPRRKGKDALS
jgi:DNA-binding transcriptional ArsR family regulator